MSVAASRRTWPRDGGPLATACAAPKLIHQRRVLRQLRTEAAAHGVAEIEHRWIRDRVVDVVPVLPAGNESRVLEDAQMLGDVRLRRSHVRDELADVPLPRLQGLEELNADRLAEDAEASRHELHGVGGERGMSRSLSGHGRILRPLTRGSVRFVTYQYEYVLILS